MTSPRSFLTVQSHLHGSGEYASNTHTGQAATNPSGLQLARMANKPKRKRTKSLRPAWIINDRLAPQQDWSVPDNNLIFQRELTRYWKGTYGPIDTGAWSTAAAFYTVKNIYNQARHLSGFGFFMHWNRLRASNWTYPGYPWYLSWPSPWSYAPGLWPIPATPTMDTLELRIQPGPNPDSETPIWWLWHSPPANPTHFDMYLVFWMSHPGKLFTNLKQGPMTQVAGDWAYTEYTSPWFTRCRIHHPALIPGRAITCAYQLIDPNNGSESPIVFQQLTAAPY